MSDILERYIRYGDKKGSHDADQRRIILLTVSLFTKFGYSLQYFKDETITIQKLIRMFDSSMTPAIISKHIKIVNYFKENTHCILVQKHYICGYGKLGGMSLME